jgi:putative oxidoreductase
MKIIAITAQILIGLTLLCFGLIALLHLMAKLPLWCVPQQFIATILLSRYMVFLFGFQLLGGLLLLAGRWNVLAFVLLGPIALNVVFFHLLMRPGGFSFALALALALLESLAMWTCRSVFRSRLTLRSDSHV